MFENDERKANVYPFVKKYCDEVHKKFIDECLEKIVKISFEEKLEKIKTDMRKIVSESFTKDI